MDGFGIVFVAAVVVFVIWMRIRLYGLHVARRATPRDWLVVVAVGLLLFATAGAVEALLIDR